MENDKSIKIINFLKIRGPSLPVHVAKQIQLNLIFTGAYLSGMLREREIRISDLKIGGSPLYYLAGQEDQLERFYNYLPPKEKQAFLLLREKKILLDIEQEPSIRFALRQIKDFSFPLQEGERLFWRFNSISEQEARELISKIKPKEIKKIVREERRLVTIEKPEKRKEKREEKIEKRKEKIEEKQLIKLKKVKEKKIKEKSWFVLSVLDFLKHQDIEVLEEIDWKKREYESRVRINSDLGKIEFFCLAKDKKSITENDLTLVLNKSRDLKLPALIISKAGLNKKAEQYLQEWKNLIKFLRIQ